MNRRILLGLAVTVLAAVAMIALFSFLFSMF